jgi:hypothetical protein
MCGERNPRPADGVHAPVPRERMTAEARLRRDAYAVTPGARLPRTEFGFLCLEEWKRQGMPDVQPFSPEGMRLFDYEDSGNFGLWNLGWCEAAYVPRFEVKIIEDRGETEIEQDWAGRHVLYFKGRRNGFMPEYVGHPVRDLASWEHQCAWRLDPDTPERWKGFDALMEKAKAAAARGEMITQHIGGSFMILRAMMGVENLLLAFYDQPGLIESIMRKWLDLADAVTARVQQHVTFDEVFFAEDNCYNHGPLVSPAMIRSLLLPYYRELLRRIRARQLDPARHLYVQIDTDGDCRPLIPLYAEELGMDVMSPFEVASGCDVVAIGREYPKLCLRGGIDKRVLARGRRAIDGMVERILPAMRARGGYIPTCDHTVPAEVPYEDYLYFRRRCIELGG